MDKRKQLDIELKELKREIDSRRKLEPDTETLKSKVKDLRYIINSDKPLSTKETETLNNIIEDITRDIKHLKKGIEPSTSRKKLTEKLEKLEFELLDLDII